MFSAFITSKPASRSASIASSICHELSTHRLRFTAELWIRLVLMRKRSSSEKIVANFSSSTNEKSRERIVSSTWSFLRIRIGTTTGADMPRITVPGLRLSPKGRT